MLVGTDCKSALSGLGIIIINYLNSYLVSIKKSPTFVELLV